MRSEFFKEHTFLDFIAGGLNIGLMVAIDLTGSNGNPSVPGSLHYLSQVEQTRMSDVYFSPLSSILLSNPTNIKRPSAALVEFWRLMTQMGNIRVTVLVPSMWGPIISWPLLGRYEDTITIRILCAALRMPSTCLRPGRDNHTLVYLLLALAVHEPRQIPSLNRS